MACDVAQHQGDQQVWSAVAPHPEGSWYHRRSFAALQRVLFAFEATHATCQKTLHSRVKCPFASSTKNKSAIKFCKGKTTAVNVKAEDGHEAESFTNC